MAEGAAAEPSVRHAAALVVRSHRVREVRLHVTMRLCLLPATLNHLVAAIDDGTAAGLGISGGAAVDAPAVDAPPSVRRTPAFIPDTSALPMEARRKVDKGVALLRAALGGDGAAWERAADILDEARNLLSAAAAATTAATTAAAAAAAATSVDLLYALVLASDPQSRDKGEAWNVVRAYAERISQLGAPCQPLLLLVLARLDHGGAFVALQPRASPLTTDCLACLALYAQQAPQSRPTEPPGTSHPAAAAGGGGVCAGADSSHATEYSAAGVVAEGGSAKGDSLLSEDELDAVVRDTQARVHEATNPSEVLEAAGTAPNGDIPLRQMRTPSMEEKWGHASRQASETHEGSKALDELMKLRGLQHVKAVHSTATPTLILNHCTSSRAVDSAARPSSPSLTHTYASPPRKPTPAHPHLLRPHAHATVTTRAVVFAPPPTPPDARGGAGGPRAAHAGHSGKEAAQVDGRRHFAQLLADGQPGHGENDGGTAVRPAAA